jgi:hypothetical protein
MCGGVREIPLTRGFVALVDAADFAWLNQWKWHAAAGGGGREYAIRSSSAQDGECTKFVKMHRQIIGAARGVIVDHINGDPLDNRRLNLRTCTQAENLWNRPATRSSATGFKGVRFAAGAYRAEIMCAGIREHLGRFRKPEDAARAYDEAAKRLHGEFARLNFPEAV